MDEVYAPSTLEKIIKAIFSALLPVVYFVLCFKVNAEEPLVWLLPFTFICVFAYSAPFIYTQSRIKARGGESIKPYIASDALFVLLPAVICSLASALVFYIFTPDSELIWFFALILTAAFILISAYFWLSYYMNVTIARKIRARRQR